jgi:phage FluMu protein Com
MRRKAYDSNNSDTLESDLRKLKTVVAEMDTEIRALGKALHQEEPKTSESVGEVNRDVRWHCRKCGYLLAFYDQEYDVMRSRYKEHIVYMRPGVGGFIQIVCRGCSEVNTLEYVPESETGKQSEEGG